MDEANRPRARAVFLNVANLPPQAQSEALRSACAGDDALLAQVQAMLDNEKQTMAMMADPASDRLIDPNATHTMNGGNTPTADLAPRMQPGQQIGRYKLLDQIGEGGFGAVWAAEQREPVKRRVALKIIKLGMDTRQVIARFEAERQALAMMDHPNIAKVFDAGTTETGRPYFVMEYIKGIPILEYCDREKLDTRSRLELFVKVCQAIQHAHQKGIIHRDIKPTNVLVTMHDGVPVPKVIDFGIAKATNAELTEKTIFTQHRQIIGTPAYMSPEQAEMSGLDIDTRSDIYALGVLLYELLTGTTPFAVEDLMSKGYAEMMRIIREVEPHKPSTRLGTLGETGSRTAEQRRSDVRRLGVLLRGELDWIVMKCLEKDRTRRYETATGLGQDVQRYLTGEAVIAAPPSAVYRLGKFIRRNRVMVMAGGAVVAALLLGVVAFAWQASVAGHQRDMAVKAREAEATQRRLAEESAAMAEAVASFQTDMLASVDPGLLPKDPVTGEPLRDTVTVVQAMAGAVKVLDEGGGDIKNQPRVEARVRETIGNTLYLLGRYDDSEPILRKALAIRRASLPAGHLEIASSLASLAVLLQAKNNLAEAEPLLREAVEIRRKAHPTGHLDIAKGLDNLAGLLRGLNKLDEAESLYRESLQICRQALPAGSPEIASSLNNLALLLQFQGKLAEAEPLYRETLQIYRDVLPAGHPHIAVSLSNLALLLQAQNRLAEAEPLFREALQIFRATLPAEHPNIATALINLAILLQAQGKLVEAGTLYNEGLMIRRAALPAGHPDIARVLDNLAGVFKMQEQYGASEPLYREALGINRRAFPAGHPNIAASLNNLALVLQAQNKLDEAEPYFREALQIYREALPTDHPSVGVGMLNLASLLQAKHNDVEAEPLMREALRNFRAALPEGHPFLLVALRRLAGLDATMGKAKEAIALLEEVLASSRATLPLDSQELAGQIEELAQALIEVKAWERGEVLLRECLAIREKAQPDLWSTFNTKSLLGGAVLGQDRYAESESLLLNGYEGIVTREALIPTKDRGKISEALDRIVRLYQVWDAASPGKGYDTKAAEWLARRTTAQPGGPE